MKKIHTSEIIDFKPKDIFIADFFREEIMAGRLKKGDKLLPDAEIARKYSVNKRTVASGLNALVDDGLLARAPRRGTIVIKDYSNDKNSNDDSEKDDLHEHDVVSPYGMEHLFFIAETKILTFASFEVFPKQKKMWQHLIKKFNSKSKGRKMKFEPVHISNFNKDGIKLRKYMAAKNIPLDIIQCMFCNASPSNLQYLPEDLMAYTTGEDSLSENVLPDFKGLLKKIVPVYTNLPVCVWNQEMEESTGVKSLKKNIIEGKLVKTLCSSVADFSSNIEKIGPHLDNLLRHYGAPLKVGDVDINYFLEFFNEIFEGLALLEKQDYKKIFIGNNGYKSYENFSRKKHFLIETLTGIPHFPDIEYIDFKLSSSLFPPKHNLFMELSSLGIANECMEPEFASDFLRFVASQESQLFMHSCINVIPYRKSALNSLSEIDPQITRPEIDIIYDKIKFAYYPWQSYFTIDVISFAMSELFERIINGEISSSFMAADIAYQIFIEQLNTSQRREKSLVAV